MKEILLTRGKVALVDDDDYEWLSQWKWCAWHAKSGRAWYAQRGVRASDGKNHAVYMHREILKAPSGMTVDHIDGDGLNNQRLNLRIATHAENLRNRPVHRDSLTGIKGVTYDKRTGKWMAQICVNRKNVNLGCYDDPAEAAAAYDKAAIELHGAFANINNLKGTSHE